MITARHQVTVKIENKDYVLRANFGALADIEAALNLDHLGALSARLSRPKMEDLMTIFKILAQAGGTEIDVEELRNFEPQHIAQMNKAIVGALEAGFGQKPKVNNKKKA